MGLFPKIIAFWPDRHRSLADTEALQLTWNTTSLLIPRSFPSWEEFRSQVNPFPRRRNGTLERSAWRASARNREAVSGRKGCVYTGNIYINSPFLIVPHDRIIIFCQYIFCVLTSYFHTLPCNKPIHKQKTPSSADERPVLPLHPVQRKARKEIVCNRSPGGALWRRQDNPSETTATIGSALKTPRRPDAQTPRCVSETSPKGSPP